MPAAVTRVSRPRIASAVISPSTTCVLLQFAARDNAGKVSGSGSENAPENAARNE